MSDGRKTKFKEPMQNVELAKMKLEVESEAKPETPLTAEQIYLKRKAEVAQQDNADFSDYLREKASRDEQEKLQPAPVPPPAAAPQTAPRKLNRRSLLTWAAGTAVVGEADTLGYPMLTGQSIPDHGARHAGSTNTEPQRHPIDRELVNPQADVGGRRFGDWVLLMPTKMGGGTYAVNLNTGRALAWVSYWNYGDYNPISHHLCAFPSADPAKGFEWINPGRQEFADLRHSHPDRDAGGRLQHLSRALRRLANGGDGERRGNDRPRPRRAREHRSQDRRALFRHRRAEGHRGVLRPPDLARDRGAQIRLGAQRAQPGRGLAEGRRAQDLQDLSRPGDRQIRLPRHQGAEDRMGDGAHG